ncbi:MAG: outer membrane beta-barrel protein [Rhodothermales bacterium]
MRSFRYLLLAAVFVAATPLAQAQIIPKFGVAGGLNFGSLTDAAGFDLDSSTGYHVGVFGDVGFGPLAARVSLLYVKAGDIGEGDDAANVTFIAVPVDFKFRFPSPVVKPYALLGPEARFATGDLADAEARSVNLALNAGIGAELSAIVGPSVFAELRYSLDVTGFADDEFFDVPTDESFKVSVFYLRVGVGL